MLSRFAGAGRPALLHSAAGAPGSPPPQARWSILCADPYRVLEWDPWGERAGPSPLVDPFLLVEQAVSEHAALPAGRLPFAGGAVGCFGYDARLAVEPRLRAAAPRPAGGACRLPGASFGLYAWGIVWDHSARRWHAVSCGAPESGPARRLKAEADLSAAVRTALEGPSGGEGAEEAGGAGGTVEPAPCLDTSAPPGRYRAMVAAARELIAAGEIYQANVAQRLELPPPRDPLRLVRAAARHSPSPFAAYLDGGSFRMVCASPERFLSLRDRVAESHPIKGTRPRGGTPGEDLRLAAELASSAKDRAENVMIVDLVRNDLGRVCRPGTVEVPSLCRVESFASVHHLVSTVRGELAPGATRADLLRAAFPPGSMTGAPKVSAMGVIDRLEPAHRGLYAGAAGYLSACGGMDLNVVIRTIVLTGERAWLHVGGAVVADSDPEAERGESLDKALSMRVAAAVSAERGRAPRPRPARGT